MTRFRAWFDNEDPFEDAPHFVEGYSFEHAARTTKCRFIESDGVVFEVKRSVSGVDFYRVS